MDPVVIGVVVVAVAAGVFFFLKSQKKKERKPSEVYVPEPSVSAPPVVVAPPVLVYPPEAPPRVVPPVVVTPTPVVVAPPHVETDYERRVRERDENLERDEEHTAAIVYTGSFSSVGFSDADARFIYWRNQQFVPLSGGRGNLYTNQGIVSGSHRQVAQLINHGDTINNGFTGDREEGVSPSLIQAINQRFAQYT